MNARAKASVRFKIDGWIILDKPLFLTSTQAVGRVKRLFNAAKAGHAGTLDPLATGILPIALGEATKTVPFIQDGSKDYKFTAQWGEQTSTDDAEGVTIAVSSKRPSLKEINTIIPNFIGTILQVPPIYSAIHINGERAYNLARQGGEFQIPSRTVNVLDLRMASFDGQSADFEIECGKGTYVRAIARDMGRALGCLAHVTSLRRTRVGPFSLYNSVSLENLEGQAVPKLLALQNVDSALQDMTRMEISDQEAQLIKNGQIIFLPDRRASVEGSAYVSHNGRPVALGHIKEGQFISSRVFNL